MTGEVVGGDAGGLCQVADALEAGRVVGVPTDTVYGLAARLDRPRAVRRLLAVKGRPAGVALPVLISDMDQLTQLVSAWPAKAVTLAKRYWPGALTLVVPARPGVGALVGGDGRGVGVRMPDNELVRALGRRGGPLAVTSANLHGEPPCTTASALLDALPAVKGGGLVVLDGGVCDGVPSTVVDCTASPPALLRPGSISWSDITATLRSARGASAAGNR